MKTHKSRNLIKHFFDCGSKFWDGWKSVFFCFNYDFFFNITKKIISLHRKTPKGFQQVHVLGCFSFPWCERTIESDIITNQVFRGHPQYKPHCVAPFSWKSYEFNFLILAGNRGNALLVAEKSENFSPFLHHRDLWCEVSPNLSRCCCFCCCPCVFVALKLAQNLTWFMVYPVEIYSTDEYGQFQGC